MLHRALCIGAGLQQLADEIDAPTGTIKLIAGELISWAGGITETAMHAGPQDVIGPRAAIGRQKFGAEISAHADGPMPAARRKYRPGRRPT